MSILRILLLALFVTSAPGVQAAQWNGPDEVQAAAKAGNVEAQLEMGILYEYGFFMKDNRAPALAWYMLAAENGNEKAAKLADKLRGNMSPAEIQAAETLKGELQSKVKAPTQPAAIPVPAPVAPAEPMETTPGLSTAPMAPMEPAPPAMPEPAMPAAPAPEPEVPAMPEPVITDPAKDTAPEAAPAQSPEGGEVVPLKDMAPVPQ